MSEFYPEAPRVAELFDFLISESAVQTEPTDAVLVFGRKSRHVADAAAQSLAATNTLVISGGYGGKDSGDLSLHGLSEAAWLAGQLAERDVLLPDLTVLLDETAKTGVDNARNGVALLRAAGQPEQLTGVAHATSALRLGALLVREVGRSQHNIPVTVRRSAYPFNPNNPYDQLEAAQEVAMVHRKKLADVPPDMAAYAADLAQEHQRYFRLGRIANPSTADDTDHFRRVALGMLLPGTAERGVRHRASFYGRNAFYLGRAAIRRLG